MKQSNSIYALAGIAARTIADTSFSQGRSTAYYCTILKTFHIHRGYYSVMFCPRDIRQELQSSVVDESKSCLLEHVARDGYCKTLGFKFQRTLSLLGLEFSIVPSLLWNSSQPVCFRCKSFDSKGDASSC
jgi:hypothetical protein